MSNLNWIGSRGEHCTTTDKGPQRFSAVVYTHFGHTIARCYTGNFPNSTLLAEKHLRSTAAGKNFVERQYTRFVEAH